jgi:hypothetical protein
MKRKCGQFIVAPSVEPHQEPTLCIYISKLDIQVKTTVIQF